MELNEALGLRGVRKHSNLGGPQRLNRIDLYGKKLIPMEILYKVGGHGPRGPPGSHAYALGHFRLSLIEVGNLKFHHVFYQ